MPIDIKMPALSPTMEHGTLTKWLVKVGDTVASGDILAEIETDKATMEFEAVDEGTITAITVAEGPEAVKVGTVIAVLTGEDEDAAPPPIADKARTRSSQCNCTAARSRSRSRFRSSAYPSHKRGPFRRFAAR